MPPDKAQVNFTDEESRIMKSSSGFEQSYNVQAAVDTEGSMLILGTYVTNEGNDKQQLKPALESVDPELRNVTELMADSGYFQNRLSRKSSRIQVVIQRSTVPLNALLMAVL